MVSVQMLSELEEIIQFKLVPERREAIKRTWWNRLQVRRNVKFVGLDVNKTTPLSYPSHDRKFCCNIGLRVRGAGRGGGITLCVSRLEIEDF